MYVRVPLTNLTSQKNGDPPLAATAEPPYPMVQAVSGVSSVPIPLEIGLLETWKFSRIVLEVPMAIFTGEKIKYNEKNLLQIHFATEAERGEAAAGKGGIDGQTRITIPATINAPFKFTEINRPTSSVGTVLEIKEETLIEESIFPLSCTLIVQVFDQNGIIWSDAFPFTFIYRPGTTEWLAKARVSNYTDLINPFRIKQGQNLHMRLLLVYAVPVITNFGTEEAAFANLYYESEISQA